MKLYDLVEDYDAYIQGVLINEHNNQFNVLWNNDVIGIVDDTDDAINVIKPLRIKRFFVEDLLHTGHHGEEYEPKIGAKYDARRNKILLLDMDSLLVGDSLRLPLFETNYFTQLQETDVEGNLVIYTTAFENIYEKDGYTWLRTLNSIYKLYEID